MQLDINDNFINHSNQKSLIIVEAQDTKIGVSNEIPLLASNEDQSKHQALTSA